MAAGQIYFARVDASETTFGAQHLREDDQIFSFTLEQQEGDFATLRLTIRNPRVGPLTLGQKKYCWFTIDCGSGELFKFFGRLIALPENLVGDAIDYVYRARPADTEAQKAALAETLKVLPYYDRIFIDESAEEDPDHVLEGYGAIWHYPRDSLTVTISDEIQGEDGTIVLVPDEMIFDGLDIRIDGVQKTTAIISAELPWTQMATGSVDLTDWITENWQNNVSPLPAGIITSYTMTASSWPQPGTSMGNGWKAVAASCQDVYDVQVRNFTQTFKTIHNWASGSKTELTNTINIGYTGAGVPNFGQVGGTPPGSLIFPKIITQDESEFDFGEDGNGGTETVRFSRSYSHTLTVIPLNHMIPTLAVAYEANRPFTEHWHLTMVADVQPVLSDEDDAGIIRLNDLKARNLSQEAEDSSDGEIPIGDPKRRSYINSARGHQSLRHVLAIARAALRKASRIYKVTVQPLLHLMPQVTLRKSALVVDSRIRGSGQALGKIIGYSIALDGDDGAIQCSVTIACAVGRDGTVPAVEGDGLYVDKAAIEADVQEFTGRVLTFDEEIGYSIPLFDPQDDGLSFETQLTVEQVLEEDELIMNNPPATQAGVLVSLGYMNANLTGEAAVSERNSVLSVFLRAVETTASFKLRSLDGEFEPAYEIDVTDLKIPRGVNLEAA